MSYREKDGRKLLKAFKFSFFFTLRERTDPSTRRSRIKLMLYLYVFCVCVGWVGGRVGVSQREYANTSCSFFPAPLSNESSSKNNIKQSKFCSNKGKKSTERMEVGGEGGGGKERQD